MSTRMDKLKQEWRKEIVHHDKMIAYLENENLLYVAGQADEQATKLWLTEVRRRRAELTGLLT